MIDFPNRDYYNRGFRDNMRVSTKDRKEGVLEGVRVPQDSWAGVVLPSERGAR